jgi:hypothetical protein
MGTLKPGAQYIYERVGDVVYARELGASPDQRQVIGWDHNGDYPNYDPRTTDGKPLIDQLKEDKLWGEIRRAAKTNLTLQDLLERVKISYYMSAEYEKNNRKP